MTASSLAVTTKTVFSDKAYVVVAVAVAVAFWIIFNFFDGLLFFWPYVDFYIPSDAVANFVISNITAAAMGMVVSMNIYLYRHSGIKFGSSFLSGSSLGMTSSMCAGCSYVGIYLATTVGQAAVVASSFLSTYQIPIRLAALGLLIWAFYSVNKRFTKSCTK